MLAPSPIKIPDSMAERTAWLQALVDSHEVEGPHLEYKSGLVVKGLKGQGRSRMIEELTKDVSGLANAWGGVLIVGVKEGADGEGRTIPAGVEAADSNEISTEQLDQIFSANIFPPIPDLRVVPILPPGDPPKGICFAINVPQSHTAHQAKDGRYWRRRNATTESILDYEIREVMNREAWPNVEAEVVITPPREPDKPGGVHVKVTNAGSTICRYFHVDVTMPVGIGSSYASYDATKTIVRGTERGWGLKLSFNEPTVPLFPGMSRYGTFPWTRADRIEITRDLGHQLAGCFLVEVFADSRPKTQEWIRIQDVYGKNFRGEFV